MTSFLEDIVTLLPEAHRSTQFSVNDFLVILQGISAFASGRLAGDPFASINSVFAAERFATQCNAGTLQDNRDKIEKWLTFGQAYAALDDSSDLDFDQLDVGSIPEIMTVI